MSARNHSPDIGLVAETMRPIGGKACAFLRAVRIVGGSVALSPQDVASAGECRRVGYVQIGDDGKARLTGLGQAYLDRLMRAH